MSTNTEIFNFVQATAPRVPLLISSPHSGTSIPSNIEKRLNKKFLGQPNDTDLFVDKIYDFAPSMGISTISAKFSRYVVDLNRDPNGKNLYGDRRSETQLVPTIAFDQEPLHQTNQAPDLQEIKTRQELFYWPYYEKIKSELKSLTEEFGHAIFFDCHSIRRSVPSIRPEPFPDLIIGTQDGTTIDKKLEQVFERTLDSTGTYNVANNTPFKGGHLTRYFGAPNDTKVQAIQLEMCQDPYLQNHKPELSLKKTTALRIIPQTALHSLINEIKK